MTNQVLLEKIERRIRIVKGRQPQVSLPLKDWQLIEDMILEFSSSKLLKSIETARRAYKIGKGVEYKPKVR